MSRRTPRQRERLSRIQRIREVYDQLPPMECKGQCWDSCGPIDMSPTERDQFRKRGLPVPDMIPTAGMRCPSLDFAGRCNAYDIRPMICRLWGVVEDMRCPHGCVPEGGHLSTVQGFTLLGEVMEAGGSDQTPNWRSMIRDILGDPGLAESLKQFVAEGMANEQARRKAR